MKSELKFSNREIRVLEKAWVFLVKLSLTHSMYELIGEFSDSGLFYK